MAITTTVGSGQEECATANSAKRQSTARGTPTPGHHRLIRRKERDGCADQDLPVHGVAVSAAPLNKIVDIGKRDPSEKE